MDVVLLGENEPHILVAEKITKPDPKADLAASKDSRSTDQYEKVCIS